jgi:hypothetical protein
MRTTGRENEETSRKQLESVAGQLAELSCMSTGELRDRYLQVYGEPTQSRNRDHLRKKVAWQIQALAEGGLSQRALQRIEELAPLAPLRWRPNLKQIQLPAVPAGPSRPTKPRDPRLPPHGTTIKKEYRGETYEVLVLADGFEFRGERFNSLSRLARTIAGTPWNGFIFFDLVNGHEAE